MLAGRREIACPLCLAAGCCLLAWGGTARGDRFELKSGGTLVGTVIEQTGSLYVIRTREGAEVTLNRLQLAKVAPENPAYEEYLQRSRALPDTLEAHRELAAWCREQQLTAENEHHLRRVLELDPQDEAARVGLGYQRRGGRWLTRDELMQARGLQMYEGKYRTAQEIALRQRKQLSERSSADWFGQLRLWRDWLDSRRAQQVDEARAQLVSLSDPAATGAIVRMLSNEKDPWVMQQWVAALGRIDHPLATQTLVDLSLNDPDDDLRMLCLDLLTREGRQPPLLPYVRALKSEDNEIVNRAGIALREIGDVEALSPLIDALVTTHKYLIDDGQSGRLNAGMVNGGGGFSAGGKGPQIVRRDRENREVLQALVKLSGKHDFGFDEQAWRSWFINEQSSDRIRTRRDL
jgi:hypothetical protein